MYSRNYEVSIRVANEAAFRDAMNRAGKSGEDAMTRVSRSTDTATASTSRFARDTTALTGAQRNLTGTVQNAAFQVQDFAVQVASGQSVTIALAQQLPQLLGGFGLIGAVAGGLVAILGGLWLAFGGGETASERLKSALEELDQAASAARSSLDDLKAPGADLAVKYAGEEAAVRSLLAALAELAAVEAERARRGALETARTTDITRSVLSTEPSIYGAELTEGIVQLTNAFQVSVENAERLQDALDAALNGENVEQSLAAFQEIRDILAATGNEITGLPDDVQAWLREVFEVEKATREALAATQEIPGAVTLATNEAERLADAFRRAKEQAAAIPTAFAEPFRNDVLSTEFDGFGFALSPNDPPPAPRRPGGGGTTPRAQADPMEQLIDRLDSRIAQAQDRAELLRRTLLLPEDSRDANRAAIEQELAFERALTAARADGVQVSAEQEAALRATLAVRLEDLRLTGQTIAAIETEAEVRRQAEQEAVRQAQETQDYLQAQASGLAQLILGLDEGADAWKRFAAGLAEAALQAALFNSGPLAGLFGGGGLSGIADLIFNARGNVFSGGNVVPFASGGIVSSPTLFPMAGSRTGLMGEAGPEAIMPLARLPGGQLGVRTVGGGGGASVINYAPVINAQAGAEPALIEGLLARQYQQFRAEVPALVDKRYAENRRSGARL